MRAIAGAVTRSQKTQVSRLALRHQGSSAARTIGILAFPYSSIPALVREPLRHAHPWVGAAQIGRRFGEMK